MRGDSDPEDSSSLRARDRERDRDRDRGRDRRRSSLDGYRSRRSSNGTSRKRKRSYSVSRSRSGDRRRSWRHRSIEDDRHSVRRSGGRRSTSRSRSRTPSRLRDSRVSTSRIKSESRSQSRVESVKNGAEEDDAAKRRKKRTGWDAAPAAGVAPLLNAALAQQMQAVSPVQPKTSTSQRCRIYVGSLDYSITEHEIQTVFSAFGPVVNVDMPKEGNRSKGFCFVEFTDPAHADMALAGMAGTVIKGRQIKVGRPTALGGQPSALPAPTPVSTGVNATQAGAMAVASLLAQKQCETITGQPSSQHQANRIYVGCVPYTFNEDNLRKIFEPFGKILSCQLIASHESPPSHRGYGFIEFEDPAVAETVRLSMNGFEVPGTGKKLKVGQATALRNPQGPGGIGLDLTPGGSIIPNWPNPAATGANSVPVDTTSMNFAALGLAAATGANGNSGLLGTPGSTIGTGGIESSSVLLLTNMVEPKDVDDDLREEVTQECSNYGRISDVRIHVFGNDVRIFVVFESSDEAKSAVSLLHGRWFGGRQIVCRLYDSSAFMAGNYSL